MIDHLNRKIKEQELTIAALKRRVDEVEAQRDAIYFFHEDFCERVRDGGFVRLPPPDLRIVERSQTSCHAKGLPDAL